MDYVAMQQNRRRLSPGPFPPPITLADVGLRWCMALSASAHPQANAMKKPNKNKGRQKKDKKKRGACDPRFNLQRRNRGETIKKQLLHLNKTGLSGSPCRLSTPGMLLGIIYVKNCRCGTSLHVR
jgi:hypothetical protein